MNPDRLPDWPPVGAWRTRAVCIDADPNLFFPERGGDYSEALTYCERCPVRAECRDEALAGPVQGIWGGLSEKARNRIRRKSA